MADWIFVAAFVVLFIGIYILAHKDDELKVKKNAEIKARLMLQTSDVEEIEHFLKWNADYLTPEMIDQLIDRAGEVRSTSEWDRKYARVAPPEDDFEAEYSALERKDNGNIL